jgi:hypothetical protein
MQVTQNAAPTKCRCSYIWVASPRWPLGRKRAVTLAFRQPGLCRPVCLSTHALPMMLWRASMEYKYNVLVSWVIRAGLQWKPADRKLRVGDERIVVEWSAVYGVLAKQRWRVTLSDIERIPDDESYLDRGTNTSTENGTRSWLITLSMMSPRPSNLFFFCSAMFHVTLNTSSLHYLLANISSLSHSNTFLLCWPISCAFIDYRPGAAATVLYA